MKYLLILLGLTLGSSLIAQHRERPVLNTDWKQTLPFESGEYVYHHGEVFDSPEGFYAVFPSDDLTRIVMGEIGREGDQVKYQGVYECDCISTKKNSKNIKSEVTAKQVNAATQKNHAFTYCSIPQIITTLHEGNAQRFEELGLYYSYDALKTESDRRLKMRRQEESSGGGKGAFGSILIGLGTFFLGFLFGVSAGS